MSEKPKIIVIVGPTASGKTALSIRLAKEFGGEIVSADSRQVYRGLDIGTGKVTREEMQGVPHHLLDVADPTDVYTVADFVRDGRRTIEEILARGRLPIVVGGTFFYIDAFLGRVVTPEVPPNPELRARLEKYSASELFEKLCAQDLERANDIDRNNKRRIIRALEIVEAIGTVPKNESEELYSVLMLGIDTPKEKILSNIRARLLARLKQGMVEEVKLLYDEGLSYERLSKLGIEYKNISEYLLGNIEYEVMLHRIETETWKYAKRQMTWLKRDKSILWVKSDGTSEIEGSVADFLC